MKHWCHRMRHWLGRPLGPLRAVFDGGDAAAFSPLWLEVQASPPAPLARSIVWTIVIALSTTLVWSVWAEFDVVVTASGSAVPSAKTKLVQALDAGRVVAIHVKDGDAVEQGAPLLALDATIAAADRARADQERVEAALDVQRLEAQWRGDRVLGQLPDGASPQQVQRQQHLLDSRLAEQRQRLASLDQEVARKRADREAALASIRRIDATLPLLRQRLDMRERLLKEGFMAELAVIDTRLEVANAVSELAVLKERQKEAESALKAAEFARAQAQAEQSSRVATELAEARRRWQSGQQELIKAAYREDHQVLTAPMTGTVQQLVVHTVGGVVNPAQGLMVVVPQEGGIEVEAQVLNKDVGFLRVGMPATVKLDAFEFTKFGALQGVVQWIAADAVKDERLGSYYPVRIALKGTQLPVAVGGHHPVARIGMAVTADVLIGHRKAYEFFLGPLLKYQKESLRER